MRLTVDGGDIDTIIGLNPLFIILYRLTKTRGYKVILKYFTHEVNHLEPSIAFLQLISTHEKLERFWEMKFIMLLWLSLISMIPFDLSTVDSSEDGTLVESILNISKKYLDCVGKEYQGACILAMRLLTRKDVSKTHLLPFIQWQVEKLLSTNDTFQIRGHLLCLCGIFKNGQRDALLGSLQTVVQLFDLQDRPAIQKNSLLRKLFSKLTTRIGLCFLKIRACPWRYSRGPRILESNLLPSNPKSGLDIKNDPNTIDDFSVKAEYQSNQIVTDEHYEEVPDEIERVVEILLTNLSDRDTIVRWTSAKGIGRLCSRLSLEYADQIVTCVIDLLQENVEIKHCDTMIESLRYADISLTNEGTWHGSCLALAELIRRGLLLPDRLYDAIPWLLRALSYELMRGTYSLGSNVRDSACYAVWSIARAYEPKIIQPFAKDLAEALVLVSLTDREITVRRAASAAFQENAGRHVFRFLLRGCFRTGLISLRLLTTVLWVSEVIVLKT